jgi:predicted nucleic acid-binding Zn ribbon protein
VRRRAPRGVGAALAEVTAGLAPATTLARVQGCWRDALGDAVSAEAKPVGERDGTVVVACTSSVWAQELDLLGPELLERLNRALGPSAGGGATVRGLRFRVGSREARN